MALGLGKANTPMSEGSVYQSLRSLEAKHAITILRTEHSGRLIRLHLPHEIPGLVSPPTNATAPDIETMDFFEVQENRLLILKREDYKCFYTLQRLDDKNFVVEHVISRPNGDNSYRNVVAASREINNRKGAMTAEDFLRKLFRDGFLSTSELEDRLLKLRAYRLARSNPIFSTMNKQHIIEEIRRTAHDNDGVPLGVDRFEAETGIREAAWRGRFWARWGDAVREAGFTPNVLRPKTDEDVLLTQLGTFVREIQRFPTVAEMRMRKRKRENDAFPNHKVLERVGSRQELIARLAAFCDRISGWSDVKAICQSMTASTAHTSDAERESENDGGDDGFVYLALMRVGREKRYKIGKANLVESRTRQIAVTLPEELKLVHAIGTDDAYGIEQYWHKRFAEKRRSGEWFALTAKDVGAFKRRKFM